MDNLKMIGTLWMFYLVKPDCNRYLRNLKIVFYIGHLVTQVLLNIILWSIYSYS